MLMPIIHNIQEIYINMIIFILEFNDLIITGVIYLSFLS